LMSLQSQHSTSEREARDLISRDQKEDDAFGQNTRDTFALADLFLSHNLSSCKREVDRFIDLVFANPFITPTQDEQCMFVAYASSLRSGDLSRQVGASVTTVAGDVLSVGCNDVPRFGGGLYWPGEADQRDYVRGFDSNEKRRDEIIRDLIPYLRSNSPCTVVDIRSALEKIKTADNAEMVESLKGNERICEDLAATVGDKGGKLDLPSAKAMLRGTPLYSLTEFGRTVHAEMEALLSCARSGRSPVGATLYTTTFPCHNCTRHIVASGVFRVVYIEPYAKSLAYRFHYDSIEIEEKGWDRGTPRCQHKASFEPFLGLGPRRYFDLFSLRLSAGTRLERKEEKANGAAVKWSRGRGSRPRVPMDPRSYLVREEAAVQTVEKLVTL
jgi:deoxycytidylate deaminase